MSDSPTATPCCSVARRPDAAEIDAALRRLGEPGAESLSALAARVGVNKGSLHRHGQHVGAVAERHSAPPSEPGEASSAMVATPATPAAQRPATPRQRAATGATPTSAPSAHASQHPRPSDATARPLRESTENAQKLSAERLRTVATLIASDGWKGEIHIAGLAQRWNISEPAVRRLHALAALRVKSDRGTLTAQREEAVARVKSIIREELAAAKMYEQGAKEAFEQAASAQRGSKLFSVAPAKWAKMLAGMCRATALQAEKFLASITYQRPKDPTAILNVSFSTHPDFAAASERLRIILETVAPPGTAARVDEAFSVWEQGGDAALEEWRREQVEAGTMLLTQGADGSYGEGASGSEAVA